MGLNVDLSVTGEQRQLVDSFAALYARESTSHHVRAAEPLGFDGQLWKALQDSGVVAMAVDETAGGWGASELELALIAEPFGRAVASAPVIEAQVAARLLAGCGQPGAEWLSKALAGDALVTFMPRQCRGSRMKLVPAGAVADAVVALVDEQLVVAPLGDNRQGVENLASLPLADVEIGDGSAVLAEGDEARRLFSGALDLWLALDRVALAGAAQKAVELGVEYAKQRHAFGTPIGTFQAVSHPLADSATAADGARLLALKAACAFVDEPERASELAAMAFAFAYETARDATQRSLHIHGGYGFGMEQDIQLYYRRTRGWAMVYGEPAAALDRVADMRYGAVTRLIATSRGAITAKLSVARAASRSPPTSVTSTATTMMRLPTRTGVAVARAGPSMIGARKWIDMSACSRRAPCGVHGREPTAGHIDERGHQTALQCAVDIRHVRPIVQVDDYGVFVSTTS